MGPFIAQLRQVIRRLIHTPLFTAVTLITLAIGVGANTAIFSVIEGILLKPLPFRHSESLVAMRLTASGMNLYEVPLSPSTYFILREQCRVLEDVGLYDSYSANVTGVAEPERVQALNMTDGLLPILRVRPVLGRGFTREDDSAGGQDVVILGYGYWQRKFGGDRSAIGRSIKVDGKPEEIIGVLPHDFRFLDEPDPAVILPFKFDRAKTFLGNYSYHAVARLKPGVTLPESAADVARVLPLVLENFGPPPGFSLALFEQAHFGPNLRFLKQDVVGDISSTLWVLMGGLGMVLLIACANVANLLLVRTECRQQELAVRAALGASPRRLAGEMLFESLILGLLGGGLGVAFAGLALRVLLAIAPASLPRLNEIGLDGPVLLFTFIVSAAAGLLFGCIPVLKFPGTRLGTGLREGGRSLSASRERHRARNSLVVVQVSLALVLMIASGLMIRSFRAMTHVEPGFSDPAEVQTFRVMIPDAQIPDPERVIHTEEAVLRNLAAVPGVTVAGISTSIPMDDSGYIDPIYAKDRSDSEGGVPPLRQFKFVSPGYFKTVGTPLIVGRDLTWPDAYDKRSVAIVSENLAREYWHDPSNALGKQIRNGTTDDWREIVGVVGDVRHNGVDQKAPSIVYWPLLLVHFDGNPVEVRREIAFALRSKRAGSQSLMSDVRRAVWSVDANLPLAEIHTLDYYYRKSMARTSFTLVMLALAGSMALLLGIVGLYGVVAYSVSQRRREVGVRMALGARRGELVGMFVRHALGLTVVGVTLGLGAALAVMRLMSSLLFGVKPVDLVTYGVVTVVLIATAALSSYLPARRAATVNPVETLRAE
ncbi:MAG TPA: ABC transporter permease [Candidatus Dormibacteraeota bacterium]|nr:ABC transporter permease [Candidatus Dormibacteraeota bacterium]